MRILVTGAGGFVGRRTVAALCDEGHAVTALLLHGEPVPDLPVGVDVTRGDVTDGASLAGPLAGCQAVVHLAGAVGYGQTWEHCRALNVRGTAQVAGAAADAGVRRFVHMSSVAVYGRVAGRPLDETQPMRAIGDPYGDTKIEAERIARAHAASGKLDLTIVRPTVLYGPGDRLFLPRLVENLRSGRARKIGRADHAVDLLHVDDAAAFVALVLRDPRSIGGTYNLNHPANPSWGELLALVAEEIGAPPVAGRLPYTLALGLAAVLEWKAALSGSAPRLTRYAVRVIGRRYDYRLDRALALGWKPSVEPEAGLREAARLAVRGRSAGQPPATSSR